MTGAPPGGEERPLAVARLAGALSRIAAVAGGPVLVVSHGGVMRLWLMTILGAAVPLIGNGETYLVEGSGADGRFHARRWQP